MKLTIAFICIMMCSSAIAETYLSAKLSNKSDQLFLDNTGEILTIITDHGAITAPVTNTEQETFGDVKISSDRKLVGWTANVKNISYALPVSLVIFQNGKVIQKINSESIIPSWSFAKNNTAVAISNETAHFSTGIRYELYSIQTGKLLQSFGCDIDYPDVKHVISKNVPSWVWPIRGICPYTTTEPD
ncbi:MAG: hypothetical protein JWQ09_4801 [Segetibacter sp.]|nr:hypothetical protein [Segetibacter sp.]